MLNIVCISIGFSMKVKKASLNKAASKVIGIVSDIDGVLTNGEITYSSSGEELKSFHVRDGSSIKLLRNQGVEFAFISGRASKVIRKRAKELGITYVVEGAIDKAKALDRLILKGFPSSHLCAIGDDLQDLSLFDHEAVTLKITVGDAHPELIRSADFTTLRNGGKGIMVEIAELILRAKNPLALNVYSI
jgi:3-deoxy-D-manno-octulosonate 8-phosphate phosphatase (KDO 8-P phosphatase)